MSNIIIDRELVYFQHQTVDLCLEYLDYVPFATILNNDRVLVRLNNEEDVTTFIMYCVTPQCPGATGCTGPYPFTSPDYV